MNRSSTCFIKNKELVTRDIAGETIIVPIKGRVGDLDGIYTLNGVGTFIWQHIESRLTVSQLVDAVATEYDVERGDAEEDVAEFLESLETASLIKRKV